MILARENMADWDGKTTASTASAIFTGETPKTINSSGIFLIVVLFLLFISLGHTALNLKIDFASKHMTSLRETQNTLRIENERMVMTVNSYLKPKNLEKVAKRKLNMINPASEQIVVIP